MGRPLPVPRLLPVFRAPCAETTQQGAFPRGLTGVGVDPQQAQLCFQLCGVSLTRSAKVTSSGGGGGGVSPELINRGFIIMLENERLETHSPLKRNALLSELI